MKERLAKLGIGFMAVAAIGIPTAFVATANAQNPPPAGPQGGGVQGQNPFGQGQFQGQPGQPPRPMGFGGGGSAIAADGSSVYVLQGNRVLRLDKNSLAVITQVELPQPQGRPGFGGTRPENRGQRGGNGGIIPPPKEK